MVKDKNMERQLATIQRIAEVSPIEGADRIEKIRINDWWCVTEKGNFKVDDLCVYFEIDSLLPVSNPAFSFLARGSKPKKMNIDGVEHVGYRLKTIRLRGQVSQGLALPLTSLFPSLEGVDLSSGKMIGDDVTNVLEIVKYEAPVPANLEGKVKGNFPGFIPKTDEERVQNMGEIIKSHIGEKFYVTEKLDGSSMTVYKKDGVLGVCSRNLDLLETEGNTFWGLANRYNLKEKLPEGFAIQGEVVGEGIQQNPLKLTGQEFYAFSLYDINQKAYVSQDSLVTLCQLIGAPLVPMIDSHYVLEKDAQGLLSSFNGIKSHLNPQELAEGVVFRPHAGVEVEIRGRLQRFSFKVISNEYLLGEKDT